MRGVIFNVKSPSRIGKIEFYIRMSTLHWLYTVHYVICKYSEMAGNINRKRLQSSRLQWDRKFDQIFTTGFFVKICKSEVRSTFNTFKLWCDVIDWVNQSGSYLEIVFVKFVSFRVIQDIISIREKWRMFLLTRSDANDSQKNTKTKSSRNLL